MKVNIFESGQKAPKKKRGSVKEKALSLDKKGRAMLDGLHPMAFSFFAIKAEELAHKGSGGWFQNTLHIITEQPWRLTDKWVSKINSITEDWIKSALLDEPNVAEGSRVPLGPFRVYKVVPPKEDAQYPTPAIIAIDNRGWKWYFKTTKAYSFKSNDVISLTATISSHKEGISFLKRPAKISLFDDEELKT
tara:strand:+ start:542 stop:1114 length:573 start_codon:yes stop_codon:yes gene_type:complete